MTVLPHADGEHEQYQRVVLTADATFTAREAEAFAVSILRAVRRLDAGLPGTPGGIPAVLPGAVAAAGAEPGPLTQLPGNCSVTPREDNINHREKEAHGRHRRRDRPRLLRGPAAGPAGGGLAVPPRPADARPGHREQETPYRRRVGQGAAAAGGRVARPLRRRHDAGEVRPADAPLRREGRR